MMDDLNPLAPNPSWEERVIEKLRVGAVYHVSPTVMRSINLQVARDMITDQLAYRLTAFIQANHVGAYDYDVTIESPASAWQHAKQEWFPTFARWVRRPPRMGTRRATVHVDAWAMFPESTIEWPEQLHRVVIRRETTHRWLP